ncbi:MAG: hypothetical protein RIC18_14840 [Hoeflea sp.]|uniref:hypothetical protein n=1 Tax=Hoeflea sp. TaxID=1940281 RepID=UPI0032EB0102
MHHTRLTPNDRIGFGNQDAIVQAETPDAVGDLPYLSVRICSGIAGIEREVIDRAGWFRRASWLDLPVTGGFRVA